MFWKQLVSLLLSNVHLAVQSTVTYQLPMQKVYITLTQMVHLHMKWPLFQPKLTH